MKTFKFSKVRKVKSPTRGTPESAGVDFYIPDIDFFSSDVKGDFEIKGDGSIVLEAGGSILIPSGIKAKIPKGHALIFFNKSGVSTKKNLQVGACVVDEDYQGEIHLHVFNFGGLSITLKRNEKLTQAILLPVNYSEPVEVPEEELFSVSTVRGSGGFGSTGLT